MGWRGFASQPPTKVGGTPRDGVKVCPVIPARKGLLRTDAGEDCVIVAALLAETAGRTDRGERPVVGDR